MGIQKSKSQQILVELTHHLPFTIFGVVSAVLLMGILTFFASLLNADTRMVGASRELFHIFHPFHILFSAITTTAIFWKHDNKNMIKAVIIGLFGTVFVCGLSDIVMPFLGGSLLGQDMHLHICMIEEPLLVFPFAALGVFVGFLVRSGFEHSTQYSHGMHVFLSSTASLLYLLSYGLSGWVHQLPEVFLITVVAVVLPCCLSDIVFPMLCTHRYCEHVV